MELNEKEQEVINGYEIGRIFTSSDVCQDSGSTLAQWQSSQFGKAMWKYIRTHCDDNIKRIGTNSHGQALYKVVASDNESLSQSFSEDIKQIIMNYPSGTIFSSIDTCQDANLSIEKAGKVGAIIRTLIENEFSNKIKKLNLNSTPVKYIII